ncbi:MAG: hypothetical protein EAZ08_01400 [Cytophagales bacterium]|nr:MAG: hypothetical protein EAZ08_01400 [Cytophagales bacterium]
MKKTTFLLFFILFRLSIICAQQAQIDSLKSVLAKVENDTNKIEILNEIARKHVYFKPDSAIYYASKAQTLARRVGSRRGEILALNSLSGAYLNKGNLGEALQYAKQNIKITKQIGEKSIIATATVDNLLQIGLIYRSAENHRQSLYYYFQALAILKQGQQSRIYPITLSNIGRAYNNMGLYDSANYFLAQSLHLFQTKYPKDQSIALINWGDVKFRTKEYAQAKEYLLKGSAIAKTIYTRDLAVSYRLLAEIYLIEKDLAVAEDYAKKAIEVAQSGNFKYWMAQAYRVYATILETKKDMANALKYKNLFILYRDSAYSEANQGSLQIFEYEKKQGQVAILQKEKALEKASKQEQQNIFIIIILFFIIISIILGYIIRQKQQTNKILASQKAEILQQKEALELQRNALNESNHSKDKIFSIVAHDLRSPLSTLKSIFLLLKTEGLSVKELTDLLPTLGKQVNSAFDLTEELLYWARSQMNTITINPVKVQLKGVFDAQIATFEELANLKAINLLADVPESTYILADEDMLKTVLRNLITNAIKFSYRNGKITLKAQNEGNMVKISVADTGIGISEANLSQLFTNENFTTLGTAGEKGTGLGLSLCKDFIEKNGGKIWVESTKNQGTTFYFTLKKH